jgi:hypothetical protein
MKPGFQNPKVGEQHFGGSEKLIQKSKMKTRSLARPAHDQVEP